jgi:transcription termination factor NusB
VNPSQGSDNTPEVAEPEDLMLEARIQSKDKADWSRSRLKVVEREILQKAAVLSHGRYRNDKT